MEGRGIAEQLRTFAFSFARIFPDVLRNWGSISDDRKVGLIGAALAHYFGADFRPKIQVVLFHPKRDQTVRVDNFEHTFDVARNRPGKVPPGCRVPSPYFYTGREMSWNQEEGYTGCGPFVFAPPPRPEETTNDVYLFVDADQKPPDERCIALGRFVEEALEDLRAAQAHLVELKISVDSEQDP